MSAGDSTDAAHAHTDEWFAAGGNRTSDRPAGELVWNAQTGTFDTVPASQPGRPDPQFAVMTLVADTGMFADAPADQDLVYDEATGTFVAASDTASVAPSTAAPTEVEPLAPPATTGPPASPAPTTVLPADEVEVVEPLAAAAPDVVPAAGVAARDQPQFAVMMLVASQGHFAPPPYVPRAQRMAIERQKLEELFNKGDAALLEFSDDRAVFLYKELYVITLAIPPGFPHDMPRVFVTEPADLCRRDGTPLPTNSGLYHTLDFHDEYGVQVCHSSKTAWRSENALVSVVYKAFMWVEAYQYHLGSGEPIDTYLRHQDQPSARRTPVAA